MNKMNKHYNQKRDCLYELPCMNYCVSLASSRRIDSELNFNPIEINLIPSFPKDTVKQLPSNENFKCKVIAFSNSFFTIISTTKNR